MQTMCVCLLADFYMGSSELIKSIYRPSRLPAPDIPAIHIDSNTLYQVAHVYKGYIFTLGVQKCRPINRPLYSNFWNENKKSWSWNLSDMFIKIAIHAIHLKTNLTYHECQLSSPAWSLNKY